MPAPRRQSARARLLALAVPWLVAGCAALQPPHEQGAQVLAGRLTVRVESDPVRALSAAFELSGNAEHGALALTSPLGTTLAQARWKPGDVLLETPGSQQRFPDLDTLAERTLGERVPLAALFDWLRGRPWTGARSEPLGKSETGFAQLGWRVSLARQAEGWIEARRDTPPTVTMRARLDGAAQ